MLAAAAPLRILHLLAPGQLGGLERVVQSLASGHRGLGHEVSVALILDPGTRPHPLVEPLERAGVRVFELAVPGRSYREERRSVRRLLVELAPQVVHTHGYRVDVIDAAVARHMGIPVVTTSHGFTGKGWRGRSYEWVQRRSFRRFDAVVAVSRPMAVRLESGGVPGRRLHTLPNCWPEEGSLLSRAEARERLGLGDGFQIGWLGRLSPEKGPDVLLDSLALLRGSGWTASLIGSGADEPLLRARAASLGLDDRVRLHGAIAGAARLLPAFDVLVMSSRTEGTPISLFEAMAARVPVIATRVGGIPDVVSERQALLVRPENPAALARAIEATRDDPAAAAGRASAALLRLEAFRVAPWLARYERLYRSLLTPPQPTPRP